MAHARLTEGVLGTVDAALAGTDTFLEQAYPGEDGRRQPVHTVYVPRATRLPADYVSNTGSGILDVAQLAVLARPQRSTDGRTPRSAQ